MKMKSCGHSLKAPSYITLKFETAKKTHLPQVAVIAGTMGTSEQNGRKDLQKTLESSFSTLGVQPLLPEAGGGDSVWAPDHELRDITHLL